MTTEVALTLTPTYSVSMTLTGDAGSIDITTADGALLLELAPVLRGEKGESGAAGSIAATAPIQVDVVGDVATISIDQAVLDAKADADLVVLRDGSTEITGDQAFTGNVTINGAKKLFISGGDPEHFIGYEYTDFATDGPYVRGYGGVTLGTNVFPDAVRVRDAGVVVAVPISATNLSGTNTGDQNLSAYATTAAVAAGYQPLDSDLTAIAALTTTTYGRAFLALADAAAGRTALGLGTAATTASTAYDAAGAAAAAQAASQPLDSDLTAIAALTTTTFGRALLALADAAALRTAAGLGSVAVASLDTDGTLAANSDSVVASQKAVRTYVGTAVTGLLDFKGSTDCSANPNYPAASKGDAYVTSIAGKIGGASGTSVDIGDWIVALADNAGGTQASVGASWSVIEHNLTGALQAANNLSELTNAATARTNLGLGSLATQSGTFSGTSSGTNTGDQTTVSGNAGSATVLATARSIYGNNFDGSAALGQVIASTYGGTGNGFAKFSGPATTEKTFTLPNATATILTDNAAVTAVQGGTGIATYTTGDLLYASASNTLSKLAVGSDGQYLKLVSGVPAWAAGGGGGASTLDAVTAAAGAASINNGDNAIAWNWSATTAGKTVFSVTENAASTNGAGSQVLLKVGTIAASTADPLQVQTRAVDTIRVSRTGAVTITGLDGTTGSGTTGSAITVTGGQGAATSTGGALTFTSGAGGPTSGASGALVIKSGASTDGATGAATLGSGDAAGTTRLAGTVTIQAGSSTAGTGANVAVAGGSSSGGIGGGVTLTSGAAANSGAVAIASAAGTAGSGAVSLKTGSPSSGQSGAMTVQTGDGSGGATSGGLTIQVGNSSGNIAGILTLQGGSSGSAQSGDSGGVLVVGGAAGAVASVVGGLVKVTGGAGSVTTTGGAGGLVNITGGLGGLAAAGGAVNVITGAGGATGVSGALTLATGGTTNANTGTVTLQSGTPSGTNRSSGTVTVQSGAPIGTGSTGVVTLRSGSVVGAGASGNVVINAGTTRAAGGGNVTITGAAAGATASIDGGAVTITGGTGSTTTTGGVGGAASLTGGLGGLAVAGGAASVAGGQGGATGAGGAASLTSGNGGATSGNSGAVTIASGTVTSGTVADVVVKCGATTLLTAKPAGLVLSAGTVPATAADAGVAGQIAWDASFLYVCVAASTWKRTALSTW